jgi:hypothetical protein
MRDRLRLRKSIHVPAAGDSEATGTLPPEPLQVRAIGAFLPATVKGEFHTFPQRYELVPWRVCPGN